MAKLYTHRPLKIKSMRWRSSGIKKIEVGRLSAAEPDLDFDQHKSIQYQQTKYYLKRNVKLMTNKNNSPKIKDERDFAQVLQRRLNKEIVDQGDAALTTLTPDGVLIMNRDNSDWLADENDETNVDDKDFEMVKNYQKNLNNKPSN